MLEETEGNVMKWIVRGGREEKDDERDELEVWLGDRKSDMFRLWEE